MLNYFLARLLAWFHREDGQDLIEYALITAVISVGIITGLVLLGLSDAFQGWVNNIAAAIT